MNTLIIMGCIVVFLLMVVGLLVAMIKATETQDEECPICMSIGEDCGEHND